MNCCLFHSFIIPGGGRGDGECIGDSGLHQQHNLDGGVHHDRRGRAMHDGDRQGARQPDLPQQRLSCKNFLAAQAEILRQLLEICNFKFRILLSCDYFVFFLK